MKRKKIIRRNPMAKAMLERRQSPQVIPPKKGSKATHNRQKGNQDAIRDQELSKDS
mgnify:FL=1